MDDLYEEFCRFSKFFVIFTLLISCCYCSLHGIELLFRMRNEQEIQYTYRGINVYDSEGSGDSEHSERNERKEDDTRLI